MGKISLIGNFATDWIKYSDYQFKENDAGDLYIVPTEQASFSMYNPFDVAEDLFIDLINIGDLALKADAKTAELNDELKRELLIFAKKYGLLGFISASAYNRDIIGDEQVLLIPNNPISKEKMMAEDQYIKLFIPFAEAGDVVFKKYKQYVHVQKAEDSPKFFGKRPLVLDLVFSRFYAEQVRWIIDFAQMLASHFNQLLIYRRKSGHLTENVTIMAGRFHAEKIGFTINQLDKTVIAWQFDSLKTAIETIYAFAVTDETILVSRCKHCNQIFISGNLRTKYCSPACRNCANVQKSRQKNAQNKRCDSENEQTE